MKLIRRIVIGVVLLVIVALVVVYFSLDHIIKNSVQSQATSSLNLTTTLGSANLSLFGGKLNLNNLAIASPKGFASPQLLDVGSTDLAVSYGQLRNDPIHVAAITIANPKLVIEQKDGKLNFKQAIDGMPPGDSAPSNSQPMKLIVDDLKLNNAQVVVKGIGAADIPVTLPNLELKNIGTGDSAQNGAALKDVATQIITAMAASASNSSALSAEFKQVLNANVSAAMTKLGAEAQKRIANAIPGEIGQSLSKLVSNPEDLAKNPNKALESVLGGSNSSTQPSDVKKEAESALQGLLGGKKNK